MPFYFSNVKDTSSAQQLSKGGIPLANGDALLPKPPPWAYPLWNTQEAYRNISDRMSVSTAQAIDQAMSHKSEAPAKFVNVTFTVEKQSFHSKTGTGESQHLSSARDGKRLNGYQVGNAVANSSEAAYGSDLEWVRVVLTADPGVRMDDIGQGPSRRKEHRRVPSTVAIEEVKVSFYGNLF